MKIIKLEVGQPPPQKGDLLLVQGTLTDTVIAYKVALTKVVDGATEVILDKRKNIWFSYFRYLVGESWVTDCRLVLPDTRKDKCDCCDRGDEYNGFGSDGPTSFTCPKNCTCHD